MAQKVVGLIKLQIPAGKATPAPPVGPALGQHGVNIVAFTKDFNERTKNDIGLIIPVVITVYADRSFSFITKTPPAAVLLKKACGIESGSGVPNKTKVAKITKEQVAKIAEQKMPDLNAGSLDAAISIFGHHDAFSVVTVLSGTHAIGGAALLAHKDDFTTISEFGGFRNKHIFDNRSVWIIPDDQRIGGAAGRIVGVAGESGRDGSRSC